MLQLDINYATDWQICLSLQYVQGKEIHAHDFRPLPSMIFPELTTPPISFRARNASENAQTHLSDAYGIYERSRSPFDNRLRISSRIRRQSIHLHLSRQTAEESIPLGESSLEPTLTLWAVRHLRLSSLQWSASAVRGACGSVQLDGNPRIVGFLRHLRRHH